ncbi:hypothetical protein TcCL_ESM06707 [Trypanosoma cruzi]|nr:hypothetical protein TcCL_ESM06707 [Trypanosoma cruzi]
MKNIKPKQNPRLCTGECHRETVRRVSKMARTHALMNVTLSPISRRQRGQAAEKTQVARRRQPDGINTSLALPSSMRASVPQQCLTDPLPHGTPRASTGHCENRPTGAARRGSSAFTPLPGSAGTQKKAWSGHWRGEEVVLHGNIGVSPL